MDNDNMLKEDQYENEQVVNSLLETVKDLIGYLQELKVLISEGKDSNYLIGYINQSIKTGNFGLSVARDIINSGLNESKNKKQNKFNKVMGEFGKGTLKTSYGDKVTDRKQALAIAYSESGLDEEIDNNDDKNINENKQQKTMNKNKNSIRIKESVLRDLVKNTITKVLKEDFDGEEVEPFVAHGTYTLGNAGGYEIMLSNDGDAARVRDAFGSDEPETSDWLPIEYVNDEETGELEPVIDPEGYDIPLNMVMRTRTKSPEETAENDYNEYHKNRLAGITNESKKPSNKIRIKESEFVDLIRRVVLSETTKRLKEDDSDGSNKYSVKYTFEGEPYSFEKTGLDNAISFAGSMSTKHGVDVAVYDKSNGEMVKKIKFEGSDDIDSVGELYETYSATFPYATDLVAYFIFNNQERGNKVYDAINGVYGKNTMVDGSYLSELMLSYEYSWSEYMEYLEEEVKNAPTNDGETLSLYY